MSGSGLSNLSFATAIPEAVRKYGQVIDPEILEPGDLLLVARKVHNWTSRRITESQAKMFTQSHACWYHAAVSGGRFEICEATTSGVKSHEYWRYMTGEYDFKLRRLAGATPSTRSLLAFYAAVNVNSKYGFLNLLNTAHFLNSGGGWKRPLILSSGIICSQLYFEAAMRVGYLLNNIRPESVCPAHLSMSQLLQDIPISWVKV